MFNSKKHYPTLFSRIVALLLVPLLLGLDPATLAALESMGKEDFRPQADHPNPVLTPAHVKVNRKLPDYVHPQPTFTFSANPADKEFFQHSPFEEPLIPIGKTSTVEENKALAKALVIFQHRKIRDDFSSLTGFLTSYPNSAWDVSLLNNLGSLFHDTGWYSKALDSWQEAWDKGGKATGAGKTIADEALSKLINLNASLGRTEQLETLLTLAEKRQMEGSIKARVDRARDGLATMKSNPEIAFRCGPLATEKMKNIVDGNIPKKYLTRSMDSTSKGTSILQLRDLSKKMSINYKVAKRNPGAPIIVPSVVNWKLGHFAAIVDKKGDLIHLRDPTFGDDVWVSPEALDNESSGYFLVNPGVLPAGWKDVSDAEAGTVWGKGDSTNADPKNTGPGSPGTPGQPGPPKPGDPAGPGYPTQPPAGTPPDPNPPPKPPCAMASYFISLQAASLTIQDIPLFYKPAYGPDLNFQITYGQREAFQPAIFTYSNLGPLWTCNWISYLVDDPTNPGADLLHYLSNGGELTYTGYNSTTSSYTPQSKTGAVVKLTGSSSYEVDEADGSIQTYDCATTTTPRKIFLTKTTDPSGNSLTFTYDSNFRLIAATDAAGLVTTISYGSGNSPDVYKISQVTDPFGRTANFNYTSDGYLQTSTDMQGIVSRFGYSGQVLTSLTTPYGMTTFTVGQDSSKRWVQATDPQGGQERVESWDNNCSYTPASETSIPVPSGFDNSYLNFRNTFYWSKKQMMVGAGNYTDATIYHWLHEPNIATLSDQIESIRYPLESRQYRAYPSQPSPNVTGTSGQVTRSARTLDDNTTQEVDAAYNSLNNMTQISDASTTPRVTNYVYAANNIDLTEIHQGPTLPGNLTASFAYNVHHLVHIATDASGQTTTYNYNAHKQLTSILNAKGDTTTLNYDPSTGYLTSVVDPLSATEVAFTYDGFGRVRTKTDINGYTLTYDYDNLDRVTQITYPDSTTEQNVYSALDITQKKDRQNRWSRYFYNSSRQLIASMDPQSRFTNYERCICGALKSITDANGHQTSWDQDLEGRTISKSFADDTTGQPDEILYVYEDRTRRLKTVKMNISTSGLPQTTNYTYNPDDTIQQIDYTNSTISTPSVSFTYDTVLPRISKMTDGTGTTNYSYNGFWSSGAAVTGGGRLASETGPLGTTAQVAYTYDELERITGTSINSVGSTVLYDSVGRVTSATNALGTFGYAYFGSTPRLQTLTYPPLSPSHSQTANYTYFGASQDFRLSEIKNLKPSGGALSKEDLTYNAMGTIATLQQQVDSNPATLWTYGYDNADQLQSAVKTDSSATVLSRYVYGYDPAGNRSTEQNGVGVRTTTFNNLNQITGSAGGGPLQFTGSVDKPSTVTIGGRAATVDSSNNFSGTALVTNGLNNVSIVAANVNGYASTNIVTETVPTVSSTSPVYDKYGNLTNNGAGQTYTWDAKNELISIGYTGGAHTQFSYDGQSRRVSIVEWPGAVGTGTPTSSKTFVWIGNQIAEERDALGTTVTKRFFPQGEQISGTAYFYTRDHLGSIREMTNFTGSTFTLAARYDYDPYGRMSKISGSSDSDFQYAGYYEHIPSLLNLTKYRAYDSNTAKWLSRDPLPEAEQNQGPNLYAYVGNDPAIKIDQLGLQGGGIEDLTGPRPACPCGYHEAPLYSTMGLKSPDEGAKKAYDMASANTSVPDTLTDIALAFGVVAATGNKQAAAAGAAIVLGTKLGQNAAYQLMLDDLKKMVCVKN